MGNKINIKNLIKNLRKKFGADNIADTDDDEINLKERHEFNKAKAIEDTRKQLADPNVKVWKIKELYEGILADHKDNISDEDIAFKWGTTVGRVKAIILNNGYKNVDWHGKVKIIA